MQQPEAEVMPFLVSFWAQFCRSQLCSFFPQVDESHKKVTSRWITKSYTATLRVALVTRPTRPGFPIAGVGTLGLGPLSRASAAWTFLAAVVAYVLKDATQRGRIHSGKTFRYLRRGQEKKQEITTSMTVMTCFKKGHQLYETLLFFAKLPRWGLVASCGSHLVLVLLTLAGIDGGRAALMKFYPGTMSCLKLAVASLLMCLGLQILKFKKVVNSYCKKL